MAAPPVVSNLPAAPNRNDAPADFSTKADAFVAALPPMVAQENALATWMNGVAIDASSVAANAAIAAAAAASSTANANNAAASAAAAEGLPGSIGNLALIQAMALLF